MGFAASPTRKSQPASKKSRPFSGATRREDPCGDATLRTHRNRLVEVEGRTRDVSVPADPLAVQQTMGCPHCAAQGSFGPKRTLRDVRSHVRFRSVKRTSQIYEYTP